MTKLKTFPRWSIYRHFVKHALNCGNRKWKTQILTSQHMPEILAFFKSDEKLPKPNNVDLWYLYENRNVTLKPQIIFLLHCPKGNRWFAVGVSPFLSKHVFFIFDWIYRDFCCYFLSNATYQKSCLSTTVGHEVKWGRVWKAASFVNRVLKTCWQNNLRQTRMGWKKKQNSVCETVTQERCSEPQELQSPIRCSGDNSVTVSLP